MNYKGFTLGDWIGHISGVIEDESELDGNEMRDLVEFLTTTLNQELKTQWIPVSERLPDKLQDVLITFYDAEGEYDVAYMRKTFNETYKAHGSENEWVSSMGETTYADYEVSAWMPIEPYKAESEGKG